MPWKKGDKWIGQVRAGDRRIQKVFPSKAEAIAWEVAQKSMPANQWQTHSESSIGGLANEYLIYSKIMHSEKTWEEKRDLFWRFFLSVDPNTDYQKIRTDTILLYLQNQAEQRSGYAANKDRKNILAFSAWVSRIKGMDGRAIRTVDKFPEERTSRYVPREQDFWKVYAVAQGQDKIMLLAYLHTAARKSELFRLKWDDVDFEEKKIRLFTKKRKDGSMEADWLPLTDDLYNDLLIQKRNFMVAEFVFPAPSGLPYKRRYHFMRKICRKAGVRYFDWHSIRHLSATLLAQANVPLITISQILRHRTLGTTERYLKRLDNMKAALEVLKRPEKAF